MVEAEYHDGGDHAARHHRHDAGEVHTYQNRVTFTINMIFCGGSFNDGETKLKL